MIIDKDSIVYITFQNKIIGCGICFLGGFVVTAKHLLHNKNINEYKIKIKDFFFSFSEVKTIFPLKVDICVYRIIDNFNVKGTFHFLQIIEICDCVPSEFEINYIIYTNKNAFSIKLNSFSDEEITSDNPGINVGDSGSPVYCLHCKKFAGVVSGILTKEKILKISRTLHLNHIKFRTISKDEYNFKQTLLNCSINEQAKKELDELQFNYFKLKIPAKKIINRSLLLRKNYHDFAQKSNIYQNQLLAEIDFFNTLLLINMSINKESINIAKRYISEAINIYEETLIHNANTQNLENFLHAKWLKSISHKQLCEFDFAV